MIVKRVVSNCRIIGPRIRCCHSHSDPHPGTFFITSPIFYANASPHLGHLYSAVLCDAAARFQKLRYGSNVILSTGMDEHGLKIQKAAQAQHSDPQTFCDLITKEFRDLFDACSIGYTDFIRTTESRHATAVSEFWKVLSERGYIYKGSYAGWYSVPDEAFLSEDQTEVKPDTSIRVSKESGHPVEWVEEENYRFKLSSFRFDLVSWLDSVEILPLKQKKELEFLVHRLEDLSISRPSSRLSWGIPVPGDPSQTIYVWLDALVNYLTVIGYPDRSTQWPPVQILGKDIQKFHGVFWPAFLMAAGLEPPRKLIIHSHWLVDDIKMSKSLGNVVNPSKYLDIATPDGWRYFFLRRGTIHSDGNFTLTKLRRTLNSELADTLGNLLSRSTAANLNTGCVYPSISFWDLAKFCNSSVEGKQLYADLTELPNLVCIHYNNYNFYKGIEAIMETLRNCNLFFTVHSPWKLKDQGSASDLELLQMILAVSLEAVRVTSLLLQPIVPNIASKILDKLSVSLSERSLKEVKAFENRKSKLLPSEKHLVFPRINKSIELQKI